MIKYQIIYEPLLYSLYQAEHCCIQFNQENKTETAMFLLESQTTNNIKV